MTSILCVIVAAFRIGRGGFLGIERWDDGTWAECDRLNSLRGGGVRTGGFVTPSASIVAVDFHCCVLSVASNGQHGMHYVLEQQTRTEKEARRSIANEIR